MKFCKDCKYYRPHQLLPDLDKCYADQSDIDVVTGRVKYKYAVFERRRTDVYNCGPGAKLFEQKEQKRILWQRVKQLMKTS